MTIRYYRLILILIITGNLPIIWAFQEENLIKEPDNVYIQNIQSISFSKENSYFCINHYYPTDNLCIYKNNGELYKVLHIDDSFTEKYIDIVKDRNKKERIFTSEELHNISGSPEVLYENKFSKAKFLTNELLLIIGYIQYFIERAENKSKYKLHRKKMPVLFFYDIKSDSLFVKKVNPISGNLFPQVDYLEVINNRVFLGLFPVDYFEKQPESSKYVLAEYDLKKDECEPKLEIPYEYLKYNLNLALNYNYRIAEHQNTLYFMAPYTNYMFNENEDTVWFDRMVDPIKYSLNIFDSDSVKSHEEYYKMDSLSSYVLDLFIRDNIVNLILMRPNENNKNIYLCKYTLKGKFLKERILVEEKVESIFYSSIREKIIKVYMKDENWYYNEIAID